MTCCHALGIRGVTGLYHKVRMRSQAGQGSSAYLGHSPAHYGGGDQPVDQRWQQQLSEFVALDLPGPADAHRDSMTDHLPGCDGLLAVLISFEYSMGDGYSHTRW